jgi:hypothetical protein
MSMHYVSADRSIAAAGAAFACPYDDTNEIQSARRAAIQFSSVRSRFNRIMRRTLIFMGLVVV